jgi:hypothetical protein
MQRQKKSSQHKRMKILRIFFVTGIAFLLLFQSSCSTQSKIAHYSGDGEIKAMPGGGIIEGGGGCIIKFKPIKLNQPAHFIYHFKGLPHWQFELLFAIEDSREWTDKKQYEFDMQPSHIEWAEKNHINKSACYDDLKGTLAMSLKDAKGNIILEFNRPLSKLTWSRSGRGPWELYDLQNVNFTPNSSTEYILEINIEPDHLLEADAGYVLLRGGGREGISIGF